MAMSGRLQRARSVGMAVVREARREDVTFIAASIAYHAFVSMLPVLLLLTLVLSTVGGEQFVDEVLELTATVLPEPGQGVVGTALRNASGNVGASLVGVVALVWGTVRIFRAMDAAFAEIYDTDRTTSLVGRAQDALVVLLALGAAAIVAVLFESLIEVPDAVPLAGLLDALLAVFGLAVAFFPMYYVFPNMDVSVREVVPGVLVAAVGWMALRWAFDLYVSVSSKPDVYGLLGTLLLLVIWLYVGGLVLLVGAAVNATLAGRDGARGPGGERRFGRQVTDADSFEAGVDSLVREAADAGVADEEVGRVLRGRAERVEGGRRETASDRR